MDSISNISGPANLAEGLVNRISTRDATIGIIGMGYVGLPLAAASARAGFRSIGFDIDAQKLPRLNKGDSYIDAVSSDELGKLVAKGLFRATDQFAEIDGCDVIVICVPTPLTRQREPDLSHVETTAQAVADHLKRGQLVVLESTSYPGTTLEVVKPILETTGLKSGVDFFLAYSPEREDPGNRQFETTTIPKLVAGDGPDALRVASAFYASVVREIVPVSSPSVAEAAKITENVFRAVNVALVNELKVVFDRMGIDVWEVIEAAKSKPFGYMPFYPGPGLGGHCIPIDPFYLSWKAREFYTSTRFIELAGEINIGMPRYVVSKLEEALDRRLSVTLGKSRVLILGLAYKKNVSDIRESPALEIIELLVHRGTQVEYHDPHVLEIPSTREYSNLAGKQSLSLTPEIVKDFDAVLVATDHDQVDYGLVGDHARLIIDTRNVFARRGMDLSTVVKA